MAPRVRIDYDSIEADWIAGVKSVEQLAQEYIARTGDKVTRQAIVKHFGQLSIERNLSSRITARASAIVAKSIVANTVTPATKKEIVETNAVVVAQIQIAHRSDIQKKRELVVKLFAELEALTDGQDIVEQMTLALCSGDMGKLSEAAQKVASLPTRIKGVADLMIAFKTVYSMERQAFGIKDDAGDKEEGGFHLTISNQDALL